MIESFVKKNNTRDVRSHLTDQSKLCTRLILSSDFYIDKHHNESLIPVQEDQQVRNYRDKFIRKGTSNRNKKGRYVVENYGNNNQIYLGKYKLPTISNETRRDETPNETRSMTYLPVHHYTYEQVNVNENDDYDKLQEDPTVEPKIVYFQTTSIEKNEVLMVSSVTNLPTTNGPPLLMSNCFKRKQFLRYCIRDYSQDGKSFTPTAIQVEEEVAKKNQCFPPLGPPPIIQPQPPKKPALPSCPKRKDKKKKFAELDKQLLLINRQTTRFVGCHQPNDQNLTTWRALRARSSKSVLDKVSKSYIIETPLCVR